MRQTNIGKWIGVAILGGSAVIGIAPGALAIAPEAVCEATKLAEAGKYGLCRLQAAAKGVKRGEPANLTRCDAAVATKWQRAETRAGLGVCPTEGDTTVIAAFVARHTDELVAALAGGPLPNCAGDLATCEAGLTASATALGSCQSDLAVAAACGNGVVDAGEDCDFGDLGEDGCGDFGFPLGALTCGAGCVYDTSGCRNAWHRVFLTSSTHRPNFGGSGDGDAICNQLAAAAGLTGSWKVWLSSEDEDARDRIAEGEYRLIDGTVLATSIGDLLDGSLAHAIDVTERGVRINGSDGVWTGTNPNGTKAPYRCNEWNGTSADDGVAGTMSATGSSWTHDGGPTPCFDEYRLYCFED